MAELIEKTCTSDWSVQVGTVFADFTGHRPKAAADVLAMVLSTIQLFPRGGLAPGCRRVSLSLSLYLSVSLPPYHALKQVMMPVVRSLLKLTWLA